MPARFQVTFDALHPPTLADFWAEALGYEIPPPPGDFASWDDWAKGMGIPEEKWDDARALIDPDGEGPRLFFQKVPEGKTAKNRVHLDVNVTTPGTPDDERRTLVREAADRLVAKGATEHETFDNEMGHWVVMQDPEGNEFCVQ